MNSTARLALAIPFAGLSYLLLPADPAAGFTTLGHSLPVDQRDFRVFNNFADLGANDNFAPDPSFPGYFGAVQAIWKGCVEWGSELHGDGNGDPSQPGDLGSGGANFDAHFQGEALDEGEVDENVFSAVPNCIGSTIAFTESPGTTGWRIRFCDEFFWRDGPEADVGFGFDIQGIACTQYGFALGLGPSSVAGATMNSSMVSGNGVHLRSIEADDILGIQSIYGAKAPTKPRITSIAANPDGTITIAGQSFAATGNEVRFTQASMGGTGDPIVVSGVASTAGGTSIVVAVPTTAGPGDVLVRNDGQGGGSSLSNAWPFAPPPPPLAISSLSPSSVDAVTPGGGPQLLIHGNSFTGVTAVSIDGIALKKSFPAEFFVDSDTTIRVPAVPLLNQLGAVDVVVSGPLGSDTASLDVAVNDPPVIDVLGPEPIFFQTPVPAGLAMGSKPNDLVFLGVSPDLVPTVLPGIASLGIGNGFTTLIFLGAFPVDPVKGYARADLPFPGPLPPGTMLHFQAAVFAAVGGSFPLTPTNIQSGTVIF